MFKNYLVVAFRNFWRKKLFSLINIAGLAIGISAALVIYLIVSYDFSFDKFEKDRKRIYRVVTTMKFPDNDFKTSGVPLPLIALAQKEITGVELFAPFSMPNDNVNVSIGSSVNNAADIYKKQKGIVFADNNYFKLIGYKWLAGAVETSLKDPLTTVLTESRAKIYFPDYDVSKDIGKIITYNDSIKTTVTGIVKDLDETTDFTFKEFISYETRFRMSAREKTRSEEWGSVNSSDQFFVKLGKIVSPSSVQKQIQQLFDKNQKNAYLKNILSLQPLYDIHFNSDYDNFDQRLAHLPTLYGLLAVAGILLSLACINFINLTTAQAVQRAKEIGIRKTMGGAKWQLVFQFLSETFLLTLISLVISLGMVQWIIKLFGDFIPTAINSGMLANANIILFTIALLIAVSLLAGFYPALVLSKYNPITVLKNQPASGSSSLRRVWVRKSLTVTQFVFAQAFIIATLIVGQQIRYVLNKDLGFKKDGIMVVRTPFALENLAKQTETREVLLHKLQSLAGINKVCAGSEPPASSNTSMQTMKFNNGKKEIETTVDVKYCDADYFNLYNLKLIAGRYNKRTDTLTEYVINENYARFLGFKNPADAVGKFIEHDKGGVPIVGVVQDFHARSMHEPLKPLVFFSLYPYEFELNISLKPETGQGSWKASIAQIKEAYQEVYPGEDFNYTFFDESIAKFYKKERDTARLLNWCMGLAIFISCLGLLGLVIYTTTQRTKEIGVRKVLGASVPQIVSLLSKDFIQLILLAFVIAAPLAWWAMHKWLEDFAYRASFGWGIFALGGAIMFVVALLTLSIQTIRSAMADPVKSLRTE